MAEPWVEPSSRVLAALADLSPTGEQAAGGLAVPTEWFRWLDLVSVRIFGTPPEAFAPRPEVNWAGFTQLDDGSWGSLPAQAEPSDTAAEIDHDLGGQLAALDQLRVAGPPLRVGWLFVAGRLVGDDGKSRRVFHPLVTIPVTVQRRGALGRDLLVPTNEAQITPLVTDPTDRRRFESDIPVSTPVLRVEAIAANALALQRPTALRSFALDVAEAAGLATTTVAVAHEGPDTEMAKPGLRVIAGVGVFADSGSSTMTRRGALRDWARRSSDRCWTAFDSLYLAAEPPPAPDGDADPESPLVVTPVQREAIRQSRTQPITAIAGAPGTGKSHTIAAIALDALARGETVLLAAKTDATVDALVQLLDQAPGPDPTIFGGNTRRSQLAKQLSDGHLSAVDERTIDAARDRLHRASDERRDLADAVKLQLEAEAQAEGDDDASAARSLAPGLFDPDVDLDAVNRLLLDHAESGIGWFARRSRARAEGEVRALARAEPTTSLASLTRSAAAARAHRAAASLQADGGLALGAMWDELQHLDDECHEAAARWLAVSTRSEDAINRRTLAAVGALATALRSGRTARRTQLERIREDRLTAALPLWAGTLADIEDLLPPDAGLFDLVILDEASSIDQPLAAPALLRGRRAVIVGDPRQLRHVSFLSDDEQARALEARGLTDEPLVLRPPDVRRDSAFDLAAGVASVVVLDEHFRCRPHLVDFVARRLYDGQVKIATRSPLTDAVDCVDLVRLEGRRDGEGVVDAEVAWAIGELRSLWRSGVSSIGVMTPFRAQADAIEAAALATFSVDTIKALGLRIGTVHGFQGNERDHMLVSLGIGPDEGAATWRFVEDPHLFSVLMTRARRHLTIAYSADPSPHGLLADYLAQQDAPPGPPPPAGPVDGWTALLAADLRASDVDVRPAYPCGRHVVDLAIGDPTRAIAIECCVHPDGAASHIRRHLALRRQGWEILEAYPSKWGERRGELVVELLRQIRSGTATSTRGR